MFGTAKPIPFNPYGTRRSRRLMPRWLLLLLIGIAIGVAGVLYVQQRYLPPRLSAAASTQLQASFERAEAERVRLQAELTDTSARLARAQADTAKLGAEVAARTKAVERLQQDTEALVAALPPDPRNGAAAVRAASFSVEGDALRYDVVLSRDAGGKPLAAVLQFTVSGASARSNSDTAKLQPIPISIDRHASVRGKLPLPAGFRPRQTTIQVLDKPGGKLLGMRVINVG